MKFQPKYKSLNQQSKLNDLSRKCIWNSQLQNSDIFTHGRCWPPGIVVACLCLSVGTRGPKHLGFWSWGQFWSSDIQDIIVVTCVCVCVNQLSLPAFVCVCVNHLLVRTITGDLFKLGSSNLDQICKTPWLRTLLFWGGNQPLPSRSNLT